MALADLVGSLLNPLLDAIKRALGPFGKLFDLLGRFWTSFTDGLGKAKQLGADIYSEIIAWKNFKEEIHVRTGVISIPKAIDKTQELVDQLIAAWHAIVDLVKSIKKNLEATGEDDPTVEAEQAVQDIESSGIKSILNQFPKLAKGLEKVVVALAAVVQIMENFVTLIDDLSTIVQACKSIREEVETASTVFLQQKNPRRTVKLDDGGSMRIRVGNLHS